MAKLLAVWAWLGGLSWLEALAGPYIKQTLTGVDLDWSWVGWDMQVLHVPSAEIGLASGQLLRLGFGE